MKEQFYFGKLLFSGVCCLVFLECRRPFEPSLKPSDINSLVVEGYIDGNAPTHISLTRAREVSPGDTAARKYESNASVSVEDDHQNVFPLTEIGRGAYSSLNTLNLDSSHQYRLHIITSEGKEYASDYVPFKSSPPIDSIGWRITNDGGVQIYVNTHDPSNKTRYYHWDYGETWEFHSWYYSQLIYNPASNSVATRNYPVYICWQSDSSTNISLGTSAKLANDVINAAPIAYIEKHSQKMSVLYSIFVRQYALNEKGYNYLVAMKSNTENTGSIFDPQPNGTTGNIHCLTDPSERVSGYICAGNTSVKREFIYNTSLPRGWNILPDCPEVDVPNNPDSIRFFFTTGYGPYEAITGQGGGTIGYKSSYLRCVDCTLSGTNIKPSFWP
jgi:hypothetical protein